MILAQGIPLLLLVILAGAIIKQDINNIRNSDSNIQLVTISEVLSDIAHHHAVERGLSAGHLGSKGQKFAPELRGQRLKADETVTRLQSVRSIADSLDVSGLLKPLDEKLSQKRSIRSAVDNLSSTNGFFQYYSDLNALAIKS